MRMIALPRLGVRDAVFGVNSFVAAMLALYISFSLGLERPFWAMATVYITSQPLIGAVRSKAAFRLIGTIVGAVVTVLLVPALVNAPLLLSIALSLWVSACLFVSLLDRTPRGYFFILAGYTAALIGFPSVTHPEAVFTTAVLRAQEIGIGVLCASFVHAVFFPRSVTGQLSARIAGIVREAEGWARDALAPEPPASLSAERRRLATDITEVHAMATHIPFDSSTRGPRKALLLALQNRLVLLLPLVSATEDRIASLRDDAPIEPALAALIADTREWIADPAGTDADTLTTRAAALAADERGDGWRSMLTLNLLERLTELVAALTLARALKEAIVSGGTVDVSAIAATGRPLHLDYALALRSAAATFATIMICCGLWIVTAWPEGGIAAMIAAVVCCFFATMDDPVPAQRGFFVWTLASLPLGAAYLFAILPMVHSFVTLVLVLAPPFVGLGMLMAQPQWYGRMVPLMIGIAGSLALTNEFSADAAGFINGSVAQLAGVLMAIVCTRVFRSIGSATAIARLRRAGWRDLATLARNPSDHAVAAWRSRTLDRVGLISARIDGGDAASSAMADSALRELRLGLALARIGDSESATALRDAIAAHYRARSPDDDGTDLLDAIDAAIAREHAGSDPIDERRRILSAMAGLRRNICPSAPAWTPDRIAA
jgi:uncharacterized membrane protein YccC